MILPVTDIHNHLLPGVDDGFQSEENSLMAIKAMASRGVKEFIFTPHLNPDVYPDVSEIRLKAVYERFALRIPSELGIKTSLAAEYMIVNGFESRVEKPESLLVWPDRTILIEMSYFFRSQNLEQTVFELNMAGFKPILAHPERYTYMSRCLRDFEKLKNMGCRFQLNMMSVSGIYGRDSVRIMEHLLKQGWYDFIATDLHRTEQLDSILSIKPGRSLRKLLEQSLGIEF